MTETEGSLLDEVMVPRKGLTVVEVADELIVYDRANGGKLHRLDSHAALVWRLLDGTATGRQTAHDIAEAKGAPVGQITNDVEVLLRDLTQRRLSHPQGSAPDPGDDRTADPGDDSEDDLVDPNGHRLLPVIQTPCMDTVSGLGWHATDGISRGGYTLGLRTSDPTTREAARVRFSSEWTELAGLPANVSVRPPEPLTDGRLELGQVFAECTLVGRDRELDSLLDVVDRELTARVLPTRTDALFLRACVLRKDGTQYWLAPPKWWPVALVRHAALRDAGYELLACGVLVVDAREVVVPGVTDPVELNGVYTGSELPLAPGELVVLLSGWATNADSVGHEGALQCLTQLAPVIEVMAGTNLPA